MVSVDQYAGYSAIDLAKEPKFILWVKSPGEDSDFFWKEYLVRYPLQSGQVEKARTIVLQMQVVQETMQKNRVAAVWNDISDRIQDLSLANARIGVRSIYKWVAAAAVLVLVAGGLWMYNRQPSKAVYETATATKVQDVAPGGDKAILTLANGAKVVLDTADNGTISRQGNVTVIKLNGQLAYNKQGSAATEVLYNTITTPRGGQYQIVLADGSKVWLNAESSLRFPTAFAGKQRRVELSGEGYFEVAHNEQQPFVVQRGDAEVQVLGTHFNVNGYTDEPSLKVTLLQGRVLVKKSKELVYLNPGQQALVQPGDQNIKVDYDVDIEEVTAWKNGLFVFNNTPLQTIMKQLQRWYDVEVVYQGQVPKDQFNGSISRDNNLSEVLKVLEYSNVKFSVAGKTITVLP